MSTKQAKQVDVKDVKESTFTVRRGNLPLLKVVAFTPGVAIQVYNEFYSLGFTKASDYKVEVIE